MSGIGDLDAERGVVAKAEIVLVAASHVLARRIDRKAEAGGEAHLADFLDEETVARQGAADRIEIIHLRLDRLGRFASPLADRLEFGGPILCLGTGQGRGQRGSAFSCIGDNAEIRLEAHHLGRIDIQPDHLQPLWPPLPAHVLQFQAAADPDQQIAFPEIVVGRNQVHGMRIVVGDDAPAAAVGGDRRLDLFRKRKHLARCLERAARRP